MIATFREAIESDHPYLLPEEVGKILGLAPQNIRTQARENPALLGFPVVVCGARTLFPRIPFLNFFFGGSWNGMQKTDKSGVSCEGAA